MKSKYYSAYSHAPKQPLERVWPASLTQPDDAMSIQEILQRVSMGLTTGLDGSVSDDYDDDDDNDFDDPTLEPGFGKLDALQYETSEESDSIRRRYKEAIDRQAKKKADEEFQRKVDEEIKKRKQEEET